MRCFIALFLFLACAVAHADVIYGKYEPTGIVKDSTPKLSWKITPTRGGKIGDVALEVNEKAVRATFNASSSAVEYTPPEALPDGLYKVVCRVTLIGQVTIRQDWSFEINTGQAVNVSYASTYAFDEVNRIRRELGLSPFGYDQRVSDAAMAHSRYQSLEGRCGHAEEKGRAGYTGKMPWDRIQAFGYNGVCYEGACLNVDDPQESVRLLFDAPYHRIPFLQPGQSVAGVGMHSGALTIDFVLSSESGVGSSPSPNQRAIPLSWNGNESPSPLRIHGATGSVGYPIVFGYFSPQLERLNVTEMRLAGPDKLPVPCYLNTPDNDPELRSAAVLIPKAPLAANSTYTVTVSARTAKGIRLDRSWSFVTGAG